MVPQSSIPPRICEVGGKGLVLPLFESEHEWNNGLRTVVYAILLAYLFVGVSVVSDSFMTSIETITACVMRLSMNGKKRTVKVWNNTVANLTLMALGSSAPEILLSVVETLKNGNFSGDIGPSTILGSAAFNLFMIVAACIVAIPSPDSRCIDAVPVFFVTAIFSMLAYVWMVIIVDFITPNVIDIWEAVMTLMMLPIFVAVSYATDKGFLLPSRSIAEHVDKSPSCSLPATEDISSGDPIGASVIRSSAGKNSIWRSGKDENGQSDGHKQECPCILAFEKDSVEVSCGSERVEYCFNVKRSTCSGKVSCKYSMRGLSAVPGYDYKDATGVLDFLPGHSSAEVRMAVLPRRPGQRRVVFQLLLEEASSGAVFDATMDGGKECKILTVGISATPDDCDRVGAAAWSLNILDRFVAVHGLKRGMAFWQDQIREAVCCSAEEEEEDHDNANEDGDNTGIASWFLDRILTALVYPWTCFYALFIPPPHLMGGWPCFWIALLQLGLLTAVIVDLAELFGCVAHVRDSITAIIFVALGTSMPDFFASKSAAIEDEHADAAIVNVTGSNAFNVFLGIGLPWTIASIYWAVNGPTQKWRDRYPDFASTHPNGAFVVIGDDMSFHVMTFIVNAIIALALIRARRIFYGAELGGPFAPKVWSSFVLVALWANYIAISVWKSNRQDASAGEKWSTALWALGITLAICAVFAPAAKIWEKVVFPNGVANSAALNAFEEITVIPEACSGKHSRVDHDLEQSYGQPVS